MPADGTVRTRAETFAHAIDAARLTLEHCLSFTAGSGECAPLHSAHADLTSALHLLQRLQVQSVLPRPTERVAVNSCPEPDDLSQIRGIDAKTAQRLATLGITKFAQIAAWVPEDVHAIGLALDLGRGFSSNSIVDQARMLLTPCEPAGTAVAGPVAGWSPRRTQKIDVAYAFDAGSLTERELADVHADLRRGPGGFEPCNILSIAPLIARMIHTPIAVFDRTDEAPWRPSALMETATPVIVSPALGNEAESGDTIATVALAQTNGAREPVGKPATPRTVTPIHIAAIDRINALEADITALDQKPVMVPLQLEAGPNRAVAAIAMPEHVSGLARPAIPRMLPMTAPLEEADVTIKVRDGTANPLLQPLTELPLRPKRKAVLAAPLPDAPSEVSEAAVVIVKRRARERAAPDLAFYKLDDDHETNSSKDLRIAAVARRVERELAS